MDALGTVDDFQITEGLRLDSGGDSGGISNYKPRQRPFANHGLACVGNFPRAQAAQSRR